MMATVFQSQLGVGHRVGVIRDQQWFVLNGAILSRLTKNRQSPLLLTALDVTSPVKSINQSKSKIGLLLLLYTIYYHIY